MELVNALVDWLKISSSFCLVRRRLLGHNAEGFSMIIYSNYRVLTDTKEEISPEPPNQSSLISSYKRTLNSLKNTLFSHSNDWIRKLSAWSTIWGKMLLGKSRKFNQTLNTAPVIFLINQNRLKCNPGILNPKFIRPLSTSWKILFFFLLNIHYWHSLYNNRF